MNSKYKFFLSLCIFLICINGLPLFSNPMKDTRSPRSLCLDGSQLNPSLMQKLIQLFDIQNLVETGTFGGDTSRLASHYFKKIYTIELKHDYFQKSLISFKNYPNIYPLEGHSPYLLKQIIPQIDGKILFWLDAHWCGENSAKWNEQMTPIREELIAIKECGLKNSIILIDDVRIFHGLPNDFPEFGGYPTINEVKVMIEEINPKYEFYILGDTAIAFPREACVEPSALLKALTKSRLFQINDANDQDILNVLAAEKIIQNLANTPEAKNIDALQRYVYPGSEAITYHLMLWQGLVELGRHHFKTASDYFQRTLNTGYTHWRIYWYLALSQYYSGNIQQAEENLRMILEKAPNFSEILKFPPDTTES